MEYYVHVNVAICIKQRKAANPHVSQAGNSEYLAFLLDEIIYCLLIVKFVADLFSVNQQIDYLFKL